MDRVRLGKSNLQVSRIAFGAWELGGDWGATDEATAIATIRHAADAGMNFFEWALKDLDLAADAAGPETIPVARAIAERWRWLVAQGYGRLDVTGARFGLDVPMKEGVA